MSSSNFFKRKTIITISAIVMIIAGVSIAIAAGNTSGYAWADALGWIDFSSNVTVWGDGVEGWATIYDTGEEISLDCSTGPDGDCSYPYGVTNDGLGNLSGWAWSDDIGWISFDCHNPETGGTSPDYSCVQSLYQVKIDDQGNFYGWAWNDTVGWISFNCNQVETGDTCSVSNYKVTTEWHSGPVAGTLVSGTFDTRVATGASFNFIVWRGSLNNGSVSFQFATSDCENGATNAPTCDVDPGWQWSAKVSGSDGVFLGPGGTSDQADVYATSGPGTPVGIVNQDVHNNKRYFRYWVLVETDSAQTATPVIEDIIVNWSP
ncbi:MAG: hypothetical protein PHP35_01905 [Candidatus Colwellbacteria bacterium]|nr:hypothetical protein [Candidatus Colwellbacteria bacterium]